jgi:DNA mismatch repair protein MSH5
LEISTTKSTVGHGTTSHPSSSLKSSTDRTIDILSQIQQDILGAEAELLIATDTIAELDCLLAFATASRDLQLHRPQMVTENVIRIQQGRHLLYEMTTDMYIANDTLLVGGSAGGAPAQQGKSLVRQAEQVAVTAFLRFVLAQMILASSNGSGKTAYAKQVGLICYMAQIGWCVKCT